MRVSSATMRLGVAMAFSVALAGCHSLRPELAQASGEPARLRGSADQPAVPPAGTWWQAYGDPTLNRLIDRALQSNRDIAIAIARIDRARSGRQAIASQAGLQLSGTASYYQVDIAERVPLPALPAGTDGLRTLGAIANWELDFFGRVKRELAAAEADISSLAAAREGVDLIVTAEVCSTYFQLQAETELGKLARRTTASQQETFRISTDKAKAGTGTEADVARAETAWRNTAAQTPLHEAAIERHRARLALLCGTVPDDLSAADLRPDSGSEPPKLPASIDATLLRRRPDIRQAEHRLAAAEARVDVAVRKFYPKIKLTGLGGWLGVDSGTLLKSGNALWAVGPSIEWPIFQSGRLRAGVAARSAEQRQAVAEYENTVLAALAEVHGGMADARAARRRAEQLAAAYAAAQRAVDLTATSYRSGATPITDLLESERSAFATRQSTIESRTALLIAHLKLSRASGGGFP